ncbi:MAG: alpha/beta hydrolase [Halopseudomonas yangmingensis]
MDIVLGMAGLLVVVLFSLRRWLLRREIPQQQAMDFNGELYRVGNAAIARRHCTQAHTSVIVMPGFMENFLYFTEFYSDPDIELILLTSSDYHLPVNHPRFSKADWAKPADYPAGTIASDAHMLNLALQHLCSCEHIRVHGHSRGGAVVLEAARQRPDLFESVEVLLEAPVLPQAKPRMQLSALLLWALPLLLPLWQQQPINARNRPLWGSLDNPRKRELIMGTPFNPRNAAIMLTNLRDMHDWTHNTGTDVFQHVRRGAILVPDADMILDTHSMRSSAQQAENLQLIDVPGGSHFVIPDYPDSIPPVSQ